MAKLTLEIDDNKLSFFMELLSHFSFVKIKETEDEGDIDEENRRNIRESGKEL